MYLGSVSWDGNHGLMLMRLGFVGYADGVSEVLAQDTTPNWREVAFHVEEPAGVGNVI